jgi:hypothetical protein
MQVRLVGVYGQLVGLRLSLSPTNSSHGCQPHGVRRQSLLEAATVTWAKHQLPAMAPPSLHDMASNPTAQYAGYFSQRSRHLRPVHLPCAMLPLV